MADHNEHKEEIKEESFMDKIADKLHFNNHEENHDGPKEHEHEHEQEKAKKKEKEKDDSSSSSSSSSSSDSESEKEVKTEKVKESSSVQAKVNRLFGREKPVHQVLGGGKSADVFLWRDKKVSASVLGTATVIWVLFELLEYHLLALICHIAIFTLATVFLWANASTFINKNPPHIPEVSLPEKPLLELASALRSEINCGLALVRDIASGRELKKFLAVIAGLWLLSIVGSSCNFLTLFYIIFVVLHTLPLLYEKHEDKVDSFAERAAVEAKKHYSVVNEKYLSKIPKVPLKMKKET